LWSSQVEIWPRLGAVSGRLPPKVLSREAPVIFERLLTDHDRGSIQSLGSFVNGRLEDPPADGNEIDVADPSTGRVIARIVDAGEAGVARAVEAGQIAFPAWRRTPARDRGALLAEFARRLSEHADELARLDTLDTGNPLLAMRADVTKGIRTLSDVAGLSMEMTGRTYPIAGLHYTQREPFGVVGRLITFNHPVLFACARLGVALVAGNCVVLKPSELAPLASLAIAELSRGLLPDGVLSVTVGGPATGAALVSHPAIGRISFTGSTATALRIQALAAASGHIKTVSFELGGKNPVVVFPDVDVDEVSAAIVRGMNFTRVQGQSCGATSRLVIHESIADEVLRRVVETASKIRIGMPADPETEMGTMISPAARSRCIAIVDEAAAGGARILAGGAPPEDPALSTGAFLKPTIVDRVAPGSGLATEEIFGPVLAAMTWRTEEEATALANEGRYGLTAAIWTQDIDRAFRMADNIDAGYIWINDVETRFPSIPFGGWGDSGVDVENGIEEILSFTRLKAINVRIR
jgi:acyl-CoA reductase-like NAD-dependent aldehyde dehydrogenase